MNLEEIYEIKIEGLGTSLHYDRFFDITFSDIFKNFLKPNLNTLKIEDLKAIKIKLISHSIGTKTWFLYDCIYTEIKKGNIRMILIEGKWYKLSFDLITQINKEFQQFLDDSSLNYLNFTSYIEK